MQIVELLKRFEEDGTLPARPGKEQYEALADDLVSAYRTGDSDALTRFVNYFQIWRLSNLEQLRRHVQTRLGIRQHAKDERTDITIDQAQSLIARLHGFESWPQLLAPESR